MKQSEITGLNLEELNSKLVELKANYQDLKRTHSISPISNPLQIRELRRSIARVSSELNNREHN